MSGSIDQKVVEMQFNNRQFESGVKESLGSLDRLKKGLQLEESAKSLLNLENVANKFTLSGIAEGVQTLVNKFSTLGIIGITTLQNIANEAINAGKQLVNSLTIQPITTGFSEYELKMGSIQTIMAGTGESLSVVNQYLRDLNTYSDKTIYSFSDMTTNIGKFTNAGVGLKDSVKAIQGISNAAAISGANAGEASRAMYNFAQALSAGHVKLMDWKSIELANMATVDFKQQLIDTAVATGKLKKQTNGLYKTLEGTVISTTKNFNESLEDQWMTTDVLITTLGKYADETTEIGKKGFAAAQDIKTFTQLLDTLKEAAGSGWAETWELIVGTFDEAKDLLTEVNNVFGGLISSSSDARNNMLRGWKDLGGREILIDALTNAFKGLVSILTPIKDAFSEIFPPMMDYNLYGFTVGLKNLTEKFTLSEEASENLKRTFKGLFAIFDIGKEAVSAIARGFGRLFEAASPAGGKFLEFTGNIGDWLVALDEAIKKGGTFNNVVEKIGDIIGKIVDGIKGAIPAVKGFFESLGKGDTEGMRKFFEKIGESFGPVAEEFGKFKETFGEIGEVLGAIIDRIKARFAPLVEVFTWVKNAFASLIDFLEPYFIKAKDAVQSNAKQFFAALDQIGAGIKNFLDGLGKNMGTPDFNTVADLINAGLVAALILGVKKFVASLSGIAGEVGGVIGSAKGILDGIKGVLDGVKGSLEAWQDSLKADILKKIAVAIAIIAASLFVLSLVDSAKLQQALIAVSTSIVALFGSMASFQKIMGKDGFQDMAKITGAMIGLSVAVLLFAFAMKKLSELDWGGIAKGLVGVGVLLGMLVGTAKLLENNTASLIKGGLGFILMAVAIDILAGAVKKFGEMDTGALIQGLIGVGVILTEVVLFTKLTGNAGNVVSTAVSLTLLGGAMLIMAAALGQLGNMSLEQIGKGLLAMAGALTIIVLALQIMPKDIAVTSLALIGVATALVILSKAMETMGGMTWEEIGKGLVVLAGALLLIAVAMQFMGTALPGAAALLVVSVALAILSQVLIAFGAMSWEAIGKGLLMLAGVFVVLGLAGLVLAPITPILLALAAAIALFGVGLLALGAGVALFATGMALLAASGAAGATALVFIVKSLIELIPFVLEAIGKGIIAFARVITEGMPVIMEAVKAYFKGLMDVLNEVLPPFIETVLNFILMLLTKLNEYVPKFVDLAMKLVAGFLKGIADNISQVVQSGIDLILNFVDGIGKKIKAISDAAFNLVISFINGIADSVRQNHDAIYDAMENLIDAMVEAIKDFVDKFAPIGEDIINGLINGVKNMAKNLAKAAKNVIQGAIDAAKNVLDSHSPSRVFEKLGVFSGQGYVIGLEAMAGKVSKASADVGNSSVDAMSDALGRVSDVLSGDMDLQPTIRPVVDMTDVEKGLRSTFGQPQGISVATSINKAASISTGMGQNGSNGGTRNTTTDNSKVEINNYYTVRNDRDMRRIDADQKKLYDRHIHAKGAPVET